MFLSLTNCPIFIFLTGKSSESQDANVEETDSSTHSSPPPPPISSSSENPVAAT